MSRQLKLDVALDLMAVSLMEGDGSLWEQRMGEMINEAEEPLLELAGAVGSMQNLCVSLLVFLSELTGRTEQEILYKLSVAPSEVYGWLRNA